MTADTKSSGGSPLERWSRLKREAARGNASPAPKRDEVVAPAIAAPAPAAIDAASITNARADTLPSVESLTIESDFAPFFQPKVGETLKRQALKQLFRDPHFNVMDGLDVYVGDYSQPDPIDPDVVRQMVQGRYIFDPPATRVNAQGHVEDVPPEEIAAGAPVDPVADAASIPALPSAQETQTAAAPGQPSPAPAQADATVTLAAPVPADFAAGAKAVQDPGMLEPPTR